MRIGIGIGLGMMPGPAAGGAPAGYPRAPATPDTATLLFAGHSFTQTGWGGVTSDGQHGGILYEDWPGATLSDFVPFGSAQQVWDLDGHLRNSDYDLVIGSEVTTDFANGYPALDSPAAANTMQHLYWYGLEAAERGAELMLLQVWAPDGAAHLDPNAAVFFEGIRRWLMERLGRAVWTIPAGQYVAALRAAGHAVYSDGLHLLPRFARGISYLEYAMLTQARCLFVRPGDEDIDQLAWDTLLTWECAGMGGPMVTEVPAYQDPLPNPLPRGGLLPLSDPSFVQRGLSVIRRTPTRFEYNPTASDSRRVASWNFAPAEGTRIQATITTDVDTYFRVGNDSDLAATGIINIVPMMAAGTHRIDVTMTGNLLGRSKIGFLNTGVAGNVRISNWLVTPP